MSIAQRTRSRMKGTAMKFHCLPMIPRRGMKNVVYATNLKSFMTNDHIVDWLKLYWDKDLQAVKTCKRKGRRKPRKRIVSGGIGKKRIPSNDGFLAYILNRGVEFEDEIVDAIKESYDVEFVSNSFSKKAAKQTAILMNKGVPFIHSAPVYNSRNNTGGIIDLLVRRDMFGEFTGMDTLSEVEGNTYVVIDIKYSTLPLRADGVHLLNSKFYPAYKAQLKVYNDAIAQIQNFEPETAYILGRKWKFTQKGQTFKGGDSFEKLGTVNFKTVDESFVQKTKDAIDWVKEVRTEGKTWEVSPPSRMELYPNMCVDSGGWNIVKKNLANENNEMTRIWNVQAKHRDLAISNGVSDSHDSLCSASLMGISGLRGPVIDKIIFINRPDTKSCVLPEQMNNTLFDWRRKKKEWFVDFEVIPEFFEDNDQGFFLFMIGAYYIDENDEEVRHTFTCDTLCKKEEKRIVTEFLALVNTERPRRLWHWYSVEPRQWEMITERHGLKRLKSKWCDLLDIVKLEPVTVKGAYNFSLKSIAKSLYDLKLIDVSWSDECCNGKDAMVQAWNYYKSPNPNVKIMKSIEKYNQVDCEVLYAILEYLRENH
jgi:hypothetical protein